MLQQGRHTCHNTGTPLGVSEAKFKTILQLTLSVKGLGLFLENFRAFSVTSSWYLCFHAVVILCLLLRSRLLIVRVMTMKFAQLSLTHIDTGTTIGGECGKICIFSSINTHCTMLCHTTPQHTTSHHITPQPHHSHQPHHATQHNAIFQAHVVINTTLATKISSRFYFVNF